MHPGLLLGAAVVGGIAAALTISVRAGAVAAVEIDGDVLRARLLGVNRALAVKGRLEVPLDHVAGVHRYGPDDAAYPRGLRMPGTGLPGVLIAGTYRGNRGRSFWAIHRGRQAVVVQCRDDPWDRLVLEVDDPDDLVARVSAATRATVE